MNFRLASFAGVRLILDTVPVFLNPIDDEYALEYLWLEGIEFFSFEPMLESGLEDLDSFDCLSSMRSLL